MSDAPTSAPGQPETTDDLVRRACAGDLAAFNALVEAHQSLVFSLCLRMLGDASAAEDATQEAFVSAWRAVARLRGSFRPWLMRIAANACADDMRRRRRRPASSLDARSEGSDAAREAPDRAPGPEEAALRTEQRRAIAAALLELPADQRLAVVLADVHGFSYEEIAETTDASLGTVKSRIARGREKLRRLLVASGTIGSPGAS
ncbi:MAG TPA: sigma-70 family RNA polymerase sigma factor [Dehalococcoidia bacterium]|nr:sigma-70 family RNA polymerase sigma factor [Dehalococcoidia bacterium]